MSNVWMLSKAQMRRIEPFFPLSHGIPRVDDRRIVSGIIYVIKHGLMWRDAYSDEAGHFFRHEAGHRTDLKPAIIPTRSRPFEGGPCGSSGLIS
jgi:hypothetical protein